MVRPMKQKNVPIAPTTEGHQRSRRLPHINHFDNNVPLNAIQSNVHSRGDTRRQTAPSLRVSRQRSDRTSIGWKSNGHIDAAVEAVFKTEENYKAFQQKYSIARLSLNKPDEKHHDEVPTSALRLQSKRQMYDIANRNRARTTVYVQGTDANAQEADGEANAFAQHFLHPIDDVQHQLTTDDVDEDHFGPIEPTFELRRPLSAPNASRSSMSRPASSSIVQRFQSGVHNSTLSLQSRRASVIAFGDALDKEKFASRRSSARSVKDKGGSPLNASVLNLALAFAEERLAQGRRGPKTPKTPKSRAVTASGDDAKSTTGTNRPGSTNDIQIAEENRKTSSSKRLASGRQVVMSENTSLEKPERRPRSSKSSGRARPKSGFLDIVAAAIQQQHRDDELRKVDSGQLATERNSVLSEDSELPVGEIRDSKSSLVDVSRSRLSMLPRHELEALIQSSAHKAETHRPRVRRKWEPISLTAAAETKRTKLPSILLHVPIADPVLQLAREKYASQLAASMADQTPRVLRFWSI
ncbi:hypothetical protein HDU85_000024 [Gaertneriomyces sp. JEL0708]|nr:hypothetical protein HDU85_000024 [Gaertneriomyces sp. JEL0708]